MTVGGERRAVVEQLEDALQAEDGDAKDFHIREAIQLLHIERKTRRATADRTDEMAE